MARARVLTFHVDGDEIFGLNDALDGVASQFAEKDDFLGLVCLAHDGRRHEVVVISLWGGPGLDDTQAESDASRAPIAATTDLGVSSKHYELLRLVPGRSGYGLGTEILTSALAS